MDSLILLSFRIALLVLLWFFVLMALNAMRRDVNAAAGITGRGGRKKTKGASPAPVPAAAPAPPRKRGEQARELSIIEGPLKGSHMEIATLQEVVLGRSPDCTFVVGDDYASGRHARLFRRGSDWFVEDLDSRNGTFVGGYRIDQPEGVNVGSDIKVGRTTVRLIP